MKKLSKRTALLKNRISEESYSFENGISGNLCPEENAFDFEKKSKT